MFATGKSEMLGWGKCTSIPSTPQIHQRPRRKVVALPEERLDCRMYWVLCALKPSSLKVGSPQYHLRWPSSLQREIRWILSLGREYVVVHWGWLFLLISNERPIQSIYMAILGILTLKSNTLMLLMYSLIFWRSLNLHIWGEAKAHLLQRLAPLSTTSM